MKMPMQWMLGLGVLAMGGLAGCRHSDTVSEGIIISVEYEVGHGGTEGLTRLNYSRAVPGGSGSWNIDAYGRLTREFLIITRPQHPDQGQFVIPVARLINVQFGDAGIKAVNESKPNPGT